jgi:transposase-like protein
MGKSKSGARASRSSRNQGSLFPASERAAAMLGSSSTQCHVVPVGKRRDGGTRYWCLQHKADATAKYGRRAKTCRAAHLAPIRPEDILRLIIDKYKAGVALWGAVPAVYDTTRLPMDRGIHVHARLTPTAKKELDYTYRAVRVLSDRLAEDGILISELDAIYYMVTSIFGYDMKYVTCSHCGYPHLDRDWFSVHPHRRHLCAGCGKHFTDTSVAIGNPILGVRAACGIKAQQSRLSDRKLDIKQADFPGGIQIWGSNPAFLWTSDRSEEEGIHVHAYQAHSEIPDLDETYGQVTIDGVRLDPSMVRVLMAQSALPSIEGRVRSISCPSCGEAHFSTGESAYSPVSANTCQRCNHEFTAPGRLRKSIGNPLCSALIALADKAPRAPQHHKLGLLPETI